MPGEYASLVVSTDPLQQSMISGTLRNAGIDFLDLANSPEGTLLSSWPVGYVEFRVRADRLQEAKDLLCANGIVCEVSERLLERSLEEILKPLLGERERDFGRLLRFLELNNKETVRALCQRAMQIGGGRELLEDLFFHLAREGRRELSILARALHGSTTAGFADRFRSDATAGEKPLRIALLGVAPIFSGAPWQLEALAPALLDRDGEIRDAAGEALFAIKGKDCGYDPEDPPAEREAAIQEILKASELA